MAVSVVYLSPTKIQASKIVLKKVPQIKSGTEITWDLKTLPQILQKLKRNLGKNIRLLLNDDLTYTVGFQQNTDESIQAQAQKVIPENLDNVIWDSQEVPSTPTSFIQVTATSSFFSTQIMPLLQKAGFVLETIEPVSQALVRLLNITVPTIFIYTTTEKTLMIATTKNLVLTTQNLTTFPTVADLAEFINFIETKHQLTFPLIFFSGLTQGFNATTYQSLKRQIKVQAINPLLGIAIKKNLHQKDSRILNLQKPTTPKKLSKRLEIFISLSLIIFIIVTILGGLYVAFNPTKTKTPNLLTPQTQTP